MATRTRPTNAAPRRKLIRLAEVLELTGLSRSTVYKLKSLGLFPQPVKIGPHAVRWYLDEVFSTSTRAPGAARGDVSDSRPDAAGLQRLVRDGSARSIQSRDSGASCVSLDTRRGLLGPGSVVWSPYELQVLRRRRRAKRVDSM